MRLIIDIESYSEANLQKTGVYRYAEDASFELLLFGVSIDGGAVKVYDVKQGEEIPEGILTALEDNAVIKSSFNAMFERVCLSRYLWDLGRLPRGQYLDPRGWHCDMVWAGYMGFPMSLKSAGAALGLDEQKMEEGGELITYFCKPYRPTSRNGYGHRNLPEHAPEKWELFKAYNQRDVEVEMAIEEKLKAHPVPTQIWEEYILDQQINDRGIQIDTGMVRKAIELDEQSAYHLREEMQRITRLANPQSVIQMQKWLKENGVELESLGKKELAKELDGIEEPMRTVLLLRQQLAMSAVKKYKAMESAVCTDGRLRGMFRFYGASRSGRFSSAITQLQNLFRNSLPDLEEARSLVKGGDYDALSMLYESVPEVLAQCVRTAFIPAEGMKFIVADFSAIEARVLSWVAGEQWRMESFREGKDIYCETASRMFHVKVEKHGENAEYRQRGKQAELSCIAEGQLVLTDKGLIPIERVTADMRVWDGCGWVKHEGVIYKGEREVIEYDGLTATPDHLLYADGIFRRFGSLAKSIESVRRSRVYDILNAGKNHCFTVSGKLVHNCGYGGSIGALRAMGALEAGMKEEELQPLVEAWRKANPRIVQLWADVEKSAMTVVKEKTTVKTHGLVFTYRGGMLYITLPSGRKLSYVKPRIGENRYGGEGLTYMGNDFTRHWARIETFGGKVVENCLSEGTLVITDKGLVRIEAVTRDMRVWDGQEYVSHSGVVYQGKQEVMTYEGLTATPDHKIYIDDRRKVAMRELAGRDSTEGFRQVYDVLNAGPRHRFAVWNGERALIASNCVQGISRDLLCHALEQLRGMRIVAHVHDEIIIECSMDTSVEAVCQKMAAVPEWASGLVLRADGYECKFYRKD